MKSEADKIKREQKETETQIVRLVDILAQSKAGSSAVMARITTLENELQAAAA